MDTQITDRPIDFIHSTSLESLPHSVRQPAINYAKFAILDFIGVTIGGLKDPYSRVICDIIKDNVKSDKGCSILGTNIKVPVDYAGFVNSVLGHLLDYDDSNVSLDGHPSVTLVPGILSIGERYNISGLKLLEAYIIGFEVLAKLGKIMSLTLLRKGWHTTSVLGVFGVIGAISKLLGFTKEQIKTAMGFGVSMASGSIISFGTPIKPIQCGTATRNGILSCLLALNNSFPIKRNIIEDRFGLLGLYYSPKMINNSIIKDTTREPI